MRWVGGVGKGGGGVSGGQQPGGRAGVREEGTPRCPVDTRDPDVPSRDTARLGLDT